MNELQKFKIFNELKTVTRGTSVQNRKKSSAEHSWSCLMLAEYFLSKMDEKIDKLKVFELLMYHDVVEIESGDRALNPKKNLPKKERIELDAAKTLKEKLPSFLGKKLLRLFEEMERNETIEAKFANAINKLDPVVQEMNSKSAWKGWSQDFLLEKKEKFFVEFPQINKEFHEILNRMDSQGFFEK